MTFTDAALPRVETASLIRFVFVEASELLRVKTELVSGEISTTRQDALKDVISFTRQGWQRVQQSKAASLLVCHLWRLALWRFPSSMTPQEVLRGL